MALLRCKMCGADLSVVPGMEICECEFCGSKQTVPKVDDERRVTMYERANHFRRNNEFDKALGMYEQILNEDRSDAEAYWSIVLCRYGIDYVVDPSSGKRIPTVNRAQYTSIYADEDYKEAIKYASVVQRELFEAEAKTIDEIQKGILEISQKEKPFDIFICYKETAADGSRTKDSVIANDIYHQLTAEGLKVFFAAITLEDKLGQAYEPYIFAALNSAKVMIVLGTKPEYFNAVWVKNEWSRFLAIIKKDPKKAIIPCYKDMDAYDLPEEFSFLQAQDMSKIGFINDLIRGIKKLTDSGDAAGANHAASNINNEAFEKLNSALGVDAFLKRAYFFIEDGDWGSAMAYCEKVLDLEPECADAYVGKLLVELRITDMEELANQNAVFSLNDSFVRACRFADEELLTKLKGYDYAVKSRILNGLKEEFERINNEAQCDILSEKFKSLMGFEDSEDYISECAEKKERLHIEMIYTSAVSIMDNVASVEDYFKVINMLEQIIDYKDARERKEECENNLQKMELSSNICAICLDGEGRHSFVPSHDSIKCCDKCYSRLNILYQYKGKESEHARGAIAFLSDKNAFIVNKYVKERIENIIQGYLSSIHKDDVSIPEVAEKREKTAYEIEEEKRRKEEEIRITNEKRQREIELQKQVVLAQNAVYEYDVQVVMDKSTGGADSEMIRYVLERSAINGWKLHSIINSRNSESAMLGQTIMIFERRIKKEG